MGQIVPTTIMAGPDLWVDTHGYLRVSLRDNDPVADHVSDDRVRSSVLRNLWSSAVALGWRF